MKTATINQLQTLPYFTKDVLRMITNESDNTLNVSIRRMLGKGKLIKLKNGCYTTKYYFEKNSHQVEYRELLASILCQPAYLSLEYVLGKYDILTEGVRAYTSVTLKTTREYENKLGSFIYRKLSKPLFTGYDLKYFNNNTYLIASKAKALFDYLYFLANRIGLNNKNYDVIKEKRLKINLMNKSDWKELKRYLRIRNNNKMKLIKLQLKPYAPNL